MPEGSKIARRTEEEEKKRRNQNGSALQCRLCKAHLVFPTQRQLTKAELVGGGNGGGDVAGALRQRAHFGADSLRSGLPLSLAFT